MKLFEIGSVVQVMLFKRYLIWSSGGPLVQWRGTIYAISKDGIMGNIHVKVIEGKDQESIHHKPEPGQPFPSM